MICCTWCLHNVRPKWCAPVRWPTRRGGWTSTRQLSNTLDIGDVTTLANPDVVEQVRVLVQGEEKLETRKGPEDIERFGEES